LQESFRKHTMTMLAICILAALACCAQTPADQGQVTPLQTMLFDNTKTIFEAQKTKNVSTLDGSLTSDFGQVGSEGMLHERKEFLDDAVEGYLTEYSVYDVKLVRVDDNAVIPTLHGILHQLEGGDARPPA